MQNAPLSSHIFSLEEKAKTLQKTNEVLEQRNKKLEKESTKEHEKNLQLQFENRILKFKCYFYEQIFRTQTDINIDELYQENEEGINIHDYNGSIPVILHDYTKENKRQVKVCEIVSKKAKKKQDKKIYRREKESNLTKEQPEVQEKNIKAAEENFEKIVQENFDVSVSETKKEINTLFEELKKSRVYQKHLSSIKESRNKLLGKMKLKDYIKLVEMHIARLDNIFTEKKQDTRKKVNNISKALSGLDQRLVFYSSYFNTPLEPEEYQNLDLSLSINLSHEFPKRYMPYNNSDLYSKIHNYGIAVFPLSQTLKRVLVNPFGFSNVVYLDKNKEEDPYTFYTLEKISENGERCWKLDCRLYIFSEYLSQNISTFCIDLFRRIYFDIFSDNKYREDFQSKALICNHDCEQLVINIFDLARTKKFCLMIQDIIVKNCSIKATKMDKFDLQSDDSLLKRQFNNKTDTTEDLHKITKRLFDEISDEDVENFCLSRV